MRRVFCPPRSRLLTYRREVGGKPLLLSFAPGEAYQFDWSHDIVVLDGATVTLKAAHVRLCHSRMMFVRA